MNDAGIKFFYKTKEQETSTNRRVIVLNTNRFTYYLKIMLATSIVVFAFNLFALFIINGLDGLFQKVISDSSSINLLFSLALSSLLESFFATNNEINSRIQKIRNNSTAILGILVLIGIILNFSYTILSVKDNENELFVYSFNINITYIIFTSLAILANIITLSLQIEKVQERK